METFECLFDASSRQAFNTSKTYFCVLLFEKPGRNTLKDKKVSGYVLLQSASSLSFQKHIKDASSSPDGSNFRLFSF